MQSHRSTTPAAPLGSRASRRRQRIVTRRHLPPLRVVPGDSAAGDGRPPTAAELVADVMALIDAGLVRADIGAGGVHYAPVGLDDATDVVMDEIVAFHITVGHEAAADTKIGEL